MLSLFHPRIARWFRERVGSPTDVQAQAWPAIAEGRHVLATAPTGSGKTLAAFLWAIDRLATGAWPGGRIRVVYVSPLKALNNDVQRNLIAPLMGIRAAFGEAGEALPEIRVQTRSGDTPGSDRRRMLTRPPEILITTPESLNLLLASPKARLLFAGVETVILDEIHAVIDTKRGTHLITAVDRLVPLAGEFQRVALSATVRPLETVADFVGGYEVAEGDGEARLRKRPVRIVRSDAPKALEVTVHAARNEASAGTVWSDLAHACGEVVRHNRSTLVFTNSRRLCERICLLMNEEAGRRVAYAHHGSLSREARAEVEQRFKRGELAAIVATNSLELGIDIGSLDEVVLVGTPGTVASAIQRVGRAGHGVGETSRGLLLPIAGIDYAYAAVMARAVRERDIEAVAPIAAPLDVLAQVIVAMTAVDVWPVDDLYAFLRTSWPYHALRRNQFDLVLEMLAGRYADGRVRFLDPLVSIDRIDGTVRARPGALPRLYGSGGTIPDRGYFNLRHAETRAKIGELDEEFVWERSLGDTFTLGAQSWSIRQITHNDVMVAPSAEGSSFVPFWRAEEGDQGRDFAEKVAAFLERADGRLDDPLFRVELGQAYAMTAEAAESLVSFLKRQRAFTRADLPHRRHVLVERGAAHAEGAGTANYILHTLWGGRANRPYGIALAQAWEEAFGERPEVRATDAGILVAAAAPCSLNRLLGFVTPGNLEGLLRRRLEQTGFFGARFRENAARALLLPRQGFRRRTPLWLHRLRSKNLFAAVLDRPDFPIMVETWRTCLQDEFDLDTLRERLGELQSGAIRVSERVTEAPSPFAAKLGWLQTNLVMYQDDTPGTSRPSRLRGDLIREVMGSSELRPRVPAETAELFQRKLQRLLPGYAPGSPVDLLDWVKERLLIPAPEWETLWEAAQREGRFSPDEFFDVARKIVRVPAGVVALEELPRTCAALGLNEGPFEDLLERPVQASRAPEDDDDRLAQWVGEWLRYYGPVSRDFVRRTLAVDEAALDEAVESLAEEGVLIAGALRSGVDEDEVCDADNFEALLRISRAERRPSLRPLPATALPLFLAQQQGLAPRGTTLDHLQDALEPLFGYPLPAEQVETDVLAARMAPYAPAMLDTLLQETDLVWVGCGERNVCFGPEESLDVLREWSGDSNREALLPSRRGRYTFSELLEHTRLPSTELTRRLWELAWQGEVANDSFAALRKAVEQRFRAPATPAGPRSRRTAFRAWKAARPFEGHWYALNVPEPVDDPIEADEISRDRVRVLLRRYGVLFRELLVPEQPLFRWPALFRTLRLMELSGEVVSGVFFEGVPGLQFASPESVRALQEPLPEDEVFWLCANDPASLCGVDVSGLKGSLPKRVATTHLAYHGTRVVLVSRRHGKEIEIRVDPEDPRLPRYLTLFRDLLSRPVRPLRSITVERINGRPAVDSEYLPILKVQFDLAVDARHAVLYRRHAIHG